MQLADRMDGAQEDQMATGPQPGLPYAEPELKRLGTVVELTEVIKGANGDDGGVGSFFEG
jgi:hypothetical protein